MQKAIFLGAALALAIPAAAVTITSQQVRVTVALDAGKAVERVEVRVKGQWTPALESAAPAPDCQADAVEPFSEGAVRGIRIHGRCGASRMVRELRTTAEPDAIDARVSYTPGSAGSLQAIEDRFDFLPERRADAGPLSGPLDFIWSQNIKGAPNQVAAHWTFKSPVVMFQQGPVFAALMPRLSDVTRDTLTQQPLALDMDVTSAARPWLSYGAVSSTPLGHSYFERSKDGLALAAGRDVKYAYWIVASAQPAKLGYRRMVRLLWEQTGHGNYLRTVDLQRNFKQPELYLFDDWRKESWVRYANQMYREFDCAGARCATLVSERNVVGDWDHPEDDAWFNSWFQTLRTAYGWYTWARNAGDKDVMMRAERVLNLALKAPQKDGAFPIIYLLKSQRWSTGDGWAAFVDDYHAFSMSWTGYWMLRWAHDLVPERKAEILAYVRRYGDFLLAKQLASGCFPSWYNANLEPREVFRDFNAETAGSALFLAELSDATGDAKYTASAQKAMRFVTNEVLPRQRWFDYETFHSCARKPFDFYDRWTAQYPQNNLSTMQAAMAYLKLYHLTKDKAYLETGREVVDYLLLTQQVWNHPLLSPKLLGGFTTQNTDAEWSDARQNYAALILLDYYNETGEQEYLERSVAAARSTFSVAPWENWAHTGFIDEKGSLTGIHWGTGSAMTSVELMAGQLGDAYVNVKRKQGTGFNACTLDRLSVDGTKISFNLAAAEVWKAPLVVRFDGTDRRATYRIAVNGRPAVQVSGAELAKNGFRAEP